jgi:hypothetical protein
MLGFAAAISVKLKFISLMLQLHQVKVTCRGRNQKALEK